MENKILKKASFYRRLWFYVIIILMIVSYVTYLNINLFGSGSHPSATQKKPLRILFLGDSLTAGYGLQVTDAYPQLVQNHFGTDTVYVINSGISGDTSYDVLSRLNTELTSHHPDIVFLCIGANDGLRQLDLLKTVDTIERIIMAILNRKKQVILAGVRLPIINHYPQDYLKKFDLMYTTLATKYHLLLLPDLLKNVAGVPELNFPDHLHPNKKGHQQISEQVIHFLESNSIVKTTKH